MIARSRLHTVPLRVKLVAAVLVLVAAALLVISVSTTFFLRSYLVGQIDADVRSYVGGLKTVSSVPRPSGESVRVGLPTDFLVVVADESGYVNPNRDVLYDSDRISFDDLPEWPTDAAGFEEHRDELRTMKARDGNPRWRMYYARLANGQYIAVGQSLSDADLAVQRLIWIDVLVGGAVLIVLASLGAAIVRTSLKPLDEIEQTAAAIAAGDLSRRVPDPERGQVEPQTELGRLSRALNTMLAQIESAFYARETSEWAARAAEAAARDALVSAQTSETRARRSEERMRQFVADASHELRTPLTTIRGFAELHRQGRPSGPRTPPGCCAGSRTRRPGWGCWSRTCCCWPGWTGSVHWCSPRSSCGCWRPRRSRPPARWPRSGTSDWRWRRTRANSWCSPTMPGCARSWATS
ncbi:hypothetical protein Prubr_35840 [Polymorphospora rubra]|uniref:histidine kinase n=1 Tax=Polymorphospora rubra TaxID=338584 RepID=A0A810N4D1_9ACTN|nr:hypothetical protein Prubr_35840 [Polymorphospora rubra]